nr:myosin phosphatase Rho-interacting protein-like [Macaca nemestrina]
MSAAKENPCRKFQTNIFNRSEYQNCFKPHESHLLNDEDLRQGKLTYPENVQTSTNMYRQPPAWSSSIKSIRKFSQGMALFPV